MPTAKLQLVPIKNETPVGAIDAVNDTYTTEFPYIPGTLEVWIDTHKLLGDQSDPNRDYDENAGFQTFTIKIDPLNPSRLNSFPCPGEKVTVDYFQDC